jgi:molybdopterin-guanine dinucleotide biosynthesis protein A
VIDRTDVEAFLLAGGASRRMGSPKAGLIVGGEPIAARVARMITPHVCRMTVVTDRPDEVAFLKIPIIPDIHPGIGPLGGLHAALHSSRSRSIVLAAIDLPFLSEHLILELLRRHGPAPATVPRTDDGLHPLCAIFDRSVLSEVERYIQEKKLSIRMLVEEVGVEIVDLAQCQPPIDPIVLANVNTPSDLFEARTRCSR